jgi:gluconokinase
VDLTKGAPRSPYEKLGGITFLPRTIDKMRAHIAGSAGAYNAKTGFSTQLFDLLSVTPDEFEEIVKANPTDQAVLDVLMARRPLSQADIDEWNERSINRSPTDDAGWARHWKQLEDAGYGDRKDVRTMYDRLDLDDGREVPRRS